MSYIPNQQADTGLYIATTNVWDVSAIYDLDVSSPEFKELFVRLYQNINNIALSLNMKDSGYFVEQEFVTGAAYFNPLTNDDQQLRSVYRRTYNIGPLGAGVTNTPHLLLIQPTWSFTRIYGAASNTTTNNYYPLPFASAGGATNIELRVNGTNIVITNNSGVTFLTCYVVLEYLKF